MAIGTPTTLGSTFTGASYNTTALGVTTASIAAGTLVVAVVTSGNNQDSSTTSPVSGVSDGTNSYTKAVGMSNPSGDNNFNEIWYFYYAAGKTTPTISASWSKLNRIQSIQIIAISGIAPSSPLDKTNSSTGTGTSASTATGTLAQASEIVIGAAVFDTTTTSPLPGSGFTNAYTTNGSFGTMTIDYSIVSSTGSVTHAPTWTGSQLYNVVVASFKAAVLSGYGFNMPMLGM